MFQKSLCVSFALFLLFSLQAGSRVVSQTTVSAVDAPLFTDLTLEIRSLSPSYLLLEPISLSIKQKNMTNRPVLGYPPILFTPYISFFVRQQGRGEWMRIGQLSLLSGLTKATHTQIPPGMSNEGRDWLTLMLSEYFPEPGRYELRARLYNDKATQHIESNVIEIEIANPTGSNRGAYNLIKDSSFKDYLFSGGDFHDAKNVLERINSLYPNSPYAKNASFVLGQAYFHSRNYVPAYSNLLRLENDNDFIHVRKVRKYLEEIRRLPTSQYLQSENK